MPYISKSATASWNQKRTIVQPASRTTRSYIFSDDNSSSFESAGPYKPTVRKSFENTRPGILRAVATTTSSADDMDLKKRFSSSTLEALKTDTDELSDGATINHEEVLSRENLVFQIVEGLRVGMDVCQQVRDWWQVVSSSAFDSSTIFKDEKLRRCLRHGSILEVLSLALTHFLGINKRISPACRCHLRNLLFYVHQNNLLLIDLLVQSSSSSALSSMIQNSGRQKRMRRWKRGEHATAIRQNNEMIINAIKLVCRSPSMTATPSSQRKGGSSPLGSVSVLLKALDTGISTGGLSYVSGGGSGSVGMSRDENYYEDELGGGSLSKTFPLPSIVSAASSGATTPANACRSFVHITNTLLRQLDRCAVQKSKELLSLYFQLRAIEVGPPAFSVAIPGLGVGVHIPSNPSASPVLPPPVAKDKKSVYTLVLDLDETLVHFFEMPNHPNGGHFLVRPGVSTFLEEMSKVYEVVIFTAATQDYADWVLDQIDPKGFISHRLYRQHAIPYGSIFVKDLSRLGRDLSRVIIVDNVAENFQLQPLNGIMIRPWFDDMSDNALQELAPLLLDIVNCKAPDVRDYFRNYRAELMRNLPLV
eukprot:GILI01007312.1.p1 GENE.GILI01007312.1~~GILI01007312.1.p1  ORF type:complete len:591 (+),score=119.68 GILI01007312.1:311-2083(+)